jgi:membrane protein DedA with SNARE-associated domain
VDQGLLDKALALTSTYGYGFLLLASLAENIFLLGFVIPGDLVVVIGGGLAARAGLSPVLTTLAVIVGTLIGSNLSFWFGRRGGSALVERWGARFGADASRIRHVETYFVAHGAKTVFVASFVSGLKNLVPAVAGASGMTFPRFFAYSAGGSVLRSAALVAIGHVCGANLERALHLVGSLNGWALGALGTALVGWLVYHFAKKRRLSREGGRKREDRVDGAAP